MIPDLAPDLPYIMCHSNAQGLTLILFSSSFLVTAATTQLLHISTGKIVGPPSLLDVPTVGGRWILFPRFGLVVRVTVCLLWGVFGG
jgi:hypothetical protein